MTDGQGGTLGTSCSLTHPRVVFWVGAAFIIILAVSSICSHSIVRSSHHQTLSKQHRSRDCFIPSPTSSHDDDSAMDVPFTSSDGPSVHSAPRPPAKDMSHHINRITKNRQVNKMKEMYKYAAMPGMISYAGGEFIGTSNFSLLIARHPISCHFPIRDFIGRSSPLQPPASRPSTSPTQTEQGSH